MSEIEDERLLHRIDTKLAIIIVKLGEIDISLGAVHRRVSFLETRIAQITRPPEIIKVHGYDPF
jgi:hypothetical protein